MKESLYIKMFMFKYAVNKTKINQSYFKAEKAGIYELKLKITKFENYIRIFNYTDTVNFTV